MNKTELRALRARYDNIDENPKLSDMEGDYASLGTLCLEALDALGDMLDRVEELEAEGDDMRERLEAADADADA